MEGTGLQYHGITKDNGGELGYNTMVYLKIREGTGLQYHGITKDNGGELGYNTMV